MTEMDVTAGLPCGAVRNAAGWLGRIRMAHIARLMLSKNTRWIEMTGSLLDFNCAHRHVRWAQLIFAPGKGISQSKMSALQFPRPEIFGISA
jgi:hypothetical protein